MLTVCSDSIYAVRGLAAYLKSIVVEIVDLIRGVNNKVGTSE